MNVTVPQKADQKIRGIEASPFATMVSYRLSRVQAKLNAQATRILKKHGDLSLTQWRVLVILSELQVSTHSEIARLTEIDKGLLSRTLKGMIEAGLIVAKASPSDNRQIQLTLSAVGYDKFEAARPAMRARQSKLLGTMSESENEILFRILSKLEAAAEISEETE